ncbi:MAG TPA: hypothetical protein VGO43_07835 [Pyrinomonadaceae bacterium]|jgi:hypothetical protein|nr:hypothetical protein [Pyrinomonadaceae bacterium]
MYSFNIKKIVGIFTLGLVAVLGTATMASAQTGNWGHNQDRKSIQEQQRIAKQQAKLEQERLRAEQARLRAEQMRNRNNGYGNGGFNNNGRYRVVRNGRNYNTDGRGAELLRQAVNQGYQQGYEAGRTDRNGRRRSSYSTSNIYRSGNYGYSSGVDSSQYQYYFQQGFQRGYQDGYNSRNQYGSVNGGSVNILGAILGSILNIQSF